MTNSQTKDLRDFVDDVCDISHLRVDADLGDGYFRLRASEAQRRQAQQDIRCCEDAVIEMLRNSRDANAKNIYVATNTEENKRNIVIIDDGDGVPKSHHKTIFEPYVTSKLDTMTQDSWGVHGRGMALYSIAVNSQQHKIVNSDNNIGCSISVVFDLNKLKEKRDQSTFPDFYVNEFSELVVRGPKNIIRTVCEFAVENRNLVNVYIGSPVEIASTLYNQEKNNKNLKLIFKDPDEKTMLTNVLSYSSDVHDFKKYALSIGLSLSKRTARRIMDGDIKPQLNILSRISNKGINNNSSKIDNNLNNSNKNDNVFDIFSIKKIHKSLPKNKTIKIDEEDKQSLKNAVGQQFCHFADKYYLDKNVQPNINIKNNKISITIELSEVE